MSRLICNDDGWLMGDGPEPLTPEAIDRRMVSTWAGTPLDTLCWCVGNSEVYHVETDVGERLGDGFEVLHDERDRRTRRDLDHLIAVAGGPLTEVARQCRAAGLALLPSIRMNSHYAIAHGAPGFGRFRRQHPEWRIGGPDEVIPAPTVEHGIRRGLDYKHPGVRQHMLAVIGELTARFDVAGVELDFMRHPAFFRVDEGRACGYLMTDFLRRVRGHLDGVGARRLLVRVPPTLDDAARLGLDVRRWLAEGLLDDLVAGGGFYAFETPLEEFVAAARGSGCRVHAGFEGLRPCLDEDLLHAVAARAWDAGVDGLYLFNYYRAEAAWKRRVLTRLVDRAGLPALAQRYELDHTDRVRGKEGHGAAFHHAHPDASLPVVLHETLPGGGAELSVRVAAGLGADRRAVLALGLEGWVDGDELEVQFGEQTLAWAARETEDGWVSTAYGAADLAAMVPVRTAGTLLRYDVSGCVRPGPIRLRVRRIEGAAPRPGATRLVEVRLEIEAR